MRFHPVLFLTATVALASSAAWGQTEAYNEHPYQWTPIGSMEHLDAVDLYFLQDPNSQP